MKLDRRAALRLAGLGVGTAVAGCLDAGGDGDDTPTGSPTDGPTDAPTDTPGETPDDAGTAITEHASVQFALRNTVPEWYRDEGDGDDGPVGHAVVVDSEDRQRDALGGYDRSGDREERVEQFLASVDYGTDRLVLVESVGPNGCHDELGVGDEVSLENGRITASAEVVDNSEEGGACTEAIVYPSALLRVTFDGDPADEVAVDVTDGWGETATVTASADDPVSAPDSSPDEQSRYVRPEGEADPVPPLECDESDVERHGQFFDEAAVRWGDFEADGGTTLALRVDGLEYEYGDTARITLTNVADEAVATGNEAKYNVQTYTEDGWRDVRVTDGDGHWAYTDEAYEHPPGEGFEWEFELTEAGLVEGTYHDDARVCPDLRAGRYRVAYFGVVGDGAVAVSFDLT